MAKTANSNSYRTRMRMERAIRMELLGYNDQDIAASIGLLPAAYAYMKGRPTYKILARQIGSGVISDLDAQIATDSGFQRKQLTNMVPAALSALFDAVTQKQDGKLRVEAARQILDRDGHLATVSRVGIATKEQGGFAANQKDMEAADAIFNALSGIKNSADLNATSSPGLSGGASSNETTPKTDNITSAIDGLITDGNNTIN